MKTDDEQQAIDFANKFGIKLEILGSEYKPMWGEQTKRTVFKLRLSRNRKSYTFEFGQSIAQGTNEPSMYDILACLTKYDPESFDDFCASYGYDTDSRSKRIYTAVCEEYNAVERLFGDILDELSEIQ